MIKKLIKKVNFWIGIADFISVFIPAQSDWSRAKKISWYILKIWCVILGYLNIIIAIDEVEFESKSEES